jgi:pyruvate/2-oxoglutarate dehydrogenase complex dihydrolipoamide dehydrogenase (E3) component
VDEVTLENGSKVVHGNENGEPRRWEADDILVGAGRQPNVESLGLDELGVTVSERGVQVDDRMRTNVPSIYASGDVAGRYLFTHSAGHESVRAVRDMFFPGRGTVGELVPWCTFTDPELAHVGMTEAEARAAHDNRVQVWRLDMDRSDRARAEGDTYGRIKAVCTRSGRLLGAHVLAPNAGEMIHELALVISRGRKLSSLSKMIHVYPTLSTSIAQLAAEATYADARRLRWLTRLAPLWATSNKS